MPTDLTTLVLLSLILIVLCAMLAVQIRGERPAPVQSTGDLTGLHVTLLAGGLADATAATRKNSEVVNSHAALLTHFGTAFEHLADRLHAAGPAPAKTVQPQPAAEAKNPPPAAATPEPTWDPAVLAKLGSGYTGQSDRMEALVARLEAMQPHAMPEPAVMPEPTATPMPMSDPPATVPATVAPPAAAPLVPA